jgi:hypothetical protein
LVVRIGCLDPGVDQLLGGAVAEKPARPVFGIGDVGAAADAELRCSWSWKPDPVPDADLLAGGKMNRDRLLDAAGGCAEPAGDGGPEGPAALAAEGGERGLDGFRG